MADKTASDLHFHPGFFTPDPRISRLLDPIVRLQQIVELATKKGLGILAVTSHSYPEHIDRRWNYYLENGINIPGFLVEELGANEHIPQALLYAPKNPNFQNNLYLLHGQEINTGQGDINIIGASCRIPVEKARSRGLEYFADMAHYVGGENVTVLVAHPARCSLPTESLRDLYNRGKIDGLEVFSALEWSWNNRKAWEMSVKAFGLPGIAVSDGHSLPDMAAAFTIFPFKLMDYDFDGLASVLKSNIRNPPANNHPARQENYLSNASRVKYLANALSTKLPF
ncbi:MAG: hypothetical protein ABIE22_04895 [archaeon]